MGVPKFYRWISERYPCLSDVVREHQIPEFDNLYLDMNGIIHTCSHPNDDDPHFRITEEKIFANICHYIDFLFKIIKPKKVFFMAVDGVAPRAKMNQQRGRRFRTAKTALVQEDKAKSLGEDLPEEARFDSNCITPGTEFMCRLHSVLQDFIVYKISTDKWWQKIRVYLSGHETPGEGEHKIMDFIRYEKSQSDYNPNTRHCLYGLDADLIMLGLCSHEPHFALLREEVKFGSKKNQKRIFTPEETTFHLLHISLLRDYLFHEFSPVKGKISFKFDIEGIIDDFVLMSFLVGNDFIPHLPQLHIHHDALPVLFKTYIEVLPTLDGYINEEGYLNLSRFEAFLNKLSEYDFHKFGELNDDFQYLENKLKSKGNTSDNEKVSTSDVLCDLGFSSMAISKMAEFDSSDETDDDTDDENSTLELEFNMHKTDYYMNKLDIMKVTPEILQDQAEGYVRAIQWNLHYYYNGVVSWSWYYPHHYSPYISDVKNFKDMKLEFELGKPFLPFQQLLAVLPKLSKNLLPRPYQKLMSDKDSPLIDYYPDDFDTDLNGKQQEWEAIVLIPFINEKLLLKFSAMADKELTEEEEKRNQHGPHLLFMHSKRSGGSLTSFLPKYYPSLKETFFKMKEIDPDFFRLPFDCIYKGLCKGVVMDKAILGFPSLRTLKHSAALKNEKVKVFQMTSQKENMMLTIKEQSENDLQKVADEIVGKSIYVGWPHFHEAFVLSVSNGKDKISCEDKVFKLKEMSPNERNIWKKQTESVEEQSYQRWGIFLGDISVLVHVKCLNGIRLVCNKEGSVVKEKQFDTFLQNYALQSTVSNLDVFSPDAKMPSGSEEVFATGEKVFLLLASLYGSMGTIVDSDTSKYNGSLLVDVQCYVEPDLQLVIRNKDALVTEQYVPGYIAAQQLGTQSYFISRLTGTVLVQTGPKESSCPNRVNVGLNLKFNHKNEEVCGFTKKEDNKWLYSDKVIKILNEYFARFPDFFEKLSQFANMDVIYLEDMYPSGDGQKVLNEISDWLKSQASSTADRQQCGMKKLDSGIVSAIEKLVKNQIKSDNNPSKRIPIPPHLLYNPYMYKGMSMPDQNTKFDLFDRVVNVRPSTCVPLGLRGTVIGINAHENNSNSICEILFDEEFFGGLSFAGSVGKGYRLPVYCLLNITRGTMLSTKQTMASPRHVVRSVPKLSQSPIFSSAISQLQVKNKSPNPVILNRNTQLPHSLNVPFYKPNSNDIFRIHSKDSPPCLPEPSTKQFVTPIAGYTKSNYSNNLLSPKERQSSVSGGQINYSNFWTDLKNSVDPCQNQLENQQKEVSHTKKSSENTYGHTFTVEELFQSVQRQNELSPLKNHSRMCHSKCPIEVLHEICKQRFNKPPSFTYHNLGNTSFTFAAIILPNGNTVTGNPCEKRYDAARDASEKALVELNLSRSDAFTSIQHRDPRVLNRPQVPVLPTDVRPMMYPPNPAFLPFLYPQVETPVMRHPPPAFSTIPDSFVATNQLLLNPPPQPPQPFPPSVPLQPPQPFPSSALTQPSTLRNSELYHLPGGGTARVINSKSNIEDNPCPMFVPAQVMKQAVKTDSSSDWPELPSRTKTNNSQIPESQRTRLSPSTAPTSSQPSPSLITCSPETSKTAKVKSKRRLAAKFENA